MLKKAIIFILLPIMIIILMMGCHISETKDGVKIPTFYSEKSYKDLELGLEDRGKGQFYITTANGDSKNRTIPTITLYTDDIIMEIIYNVKHFEESKITYLYVDGILQDTVELGKNDEGTLTLKGDSVKKGIHKVELIQFNDDQESKNISNITVYKYAQYEVTDK